MPRNYGSCSCLPLVLGGFSRLTFLSISIGYYMSESLRYYIEKAEQELNKNSYFNIIFESFVNTPVVFFAIVLWPVFGLHYTFGFLVSVVGVIKFAEYLYHEHEYACARHKIDVFENDNRFEHEKEKVLDRLFQIAKGHKCPEGLHPYAEFDDSGGPKISCKKVSNYDEKVKILNEDASSKCGQNNYKISFDVEGKGSFECIYLVAEETSKSDGASDL